MKKRISTKLTAFFVALTLVFMIGVPAFAAPDEDVMTACKGNCGQCPSLVIPGIFQSEVFLYDENGEIAVNADGEQYAGTVYL